MGTRPLGPGRPASHVRPRLPPYGSPSIRSASSHSLERIAPYVAIAVNASLRRTVLRHHSFVPNLLHHFRAHLSRMSTRRAVGIDLQVRINIIQQRWIILFAHMDVG